VTDRQVDRQTDTRRQLPAPASVARVKLECVCTSLFADAAVTTLGAGMADMKLQVTNNRGMSVASKVNETPQGYHVTYVPTDPGTHSIHVKYGGIDVPG